jgi:hypothetical protein
MWWWRLATEATPTKSRHISFRPRLRSPGNRVAAVRFPDPCGTLPRALHAASLLTRMPKAACGAARPSTIRLGTEGAITRRLA